MVPERAIAERRHCWVCAGQFVAPWPRTGDWIEVDCSTCGKYRISESLYASQFPLPDEERYRASYALKQRSLDARGPPDFTTHTFPAFIADLPNPPTHEKPGILLLSLARLHSVPGSTFPIDTVREYSLACARNDGELEYFLRGLKDAGNILTGLGHMGKAYQITHHGWAEAGKLAAESPAASKRCFVAYKFNNEMHAVYRVAIAPAIEKAGFEPRIANDPQHNERIDARIVAEIRQARFVVADVTHGPTGVYFEAGYALGEGKQVIWTCREDRHGEDMHFDTRQYNHILWRDADDLWEQLYLRIAATI
jgi:hypothetical protein